MYDNIIAYLKDLDKKWRNEYAEHGIDYSHKLLLKLYGNDFIQCFRRLNKKIKNLNKFNYDKYLFKENVGFDMTSGTWTFHDGVMNFASSRRRDNNRYWTDTDLNYETASDYFIVDGEKFDDIDSCHEFKIIKSIPLNDIYSCNKYSTDGYADFIKSTALFTKRTTFDHFGRNIMAIDLHVGAKNYWFTYNNIKRHHQVLNIYCPKFISIKIMYNSDFDPNINDAVWVNNKTTNHNDYDTHLFHDLICPSITLVSMKPIFTDAVCKFLHVIEKQTLCWELSETINNLFFTKNDNQPEDQFIYQLMVKHLITDNPVINDLFSYLNTTKSSKFTVNKNDALGYYLEPSVIHPDPELDKITNEIMHRQYYNPVIPKWMDLKNDSFFDTIMKCIKNMHYLRTQENENYRSNWKMLSDSCVSNMSEILDKVNLLISNVDKVKW